MSWYLRIILIIITSLLYEVVKLLLARLANHVIHQSLLVYQMVTTFGSFLTIFIYVMSFRSFLQNRQPPTFPCRLQHSIIGRLGLNHRVRDVYGCVPQPHRHRKFNCQLSPLGCLKTEQWNNLYFFLRKEVIQPHLPIRLPCYDFTPVTLPAFGRSLLAVRTRTSGI